MDKPRPPHPRTCLALIDLLLTICGFLGLCALGSRPGAPRHVWVTRCTRLIQALAARLELALHHMADPLVIAPIARDSAPVPARAPRPAAARIRVVHPRSTAPQRNPPPDAAADHLHADVAQSSSAAPSFARLIVFLRPNAADHRVECRLSRKTAFSALFHTHAHFVTTSYRTANPRLAIHSTPPDTPHATKRSAP